MWTLVQAVGVQGSGTKGNRLGQQIAGAIQSGIIKQKRTGGLLAN